MTLGLDEAASTWSACSTAYAENTIQGNCSSLLVNQAYLLAIVTDTSRVEVISEII